MDISCAATCRPLHHCTGRMVHSNNRRATCLRMPTLPACCMARTGGRPHQNHLPAKKTHTFTCRTSLLDSWTAHTNTLILLSWHRAAAPRIMSPASTRFSLCCVARACATPPLRCLTSHLHRRYWSRISPPRGRHLDKLPSTTAATATPVSSTPPTAKISHALIQNDAHPPPMPATAYLPPATSATACHLPPHLLPLPLPSFSPLPLSASSDRAGDIRQQGWEGGRSSHARGQPPPLAPARARPLAHPRLCAHYLHAADGLLLQL